MRRTEEERSGATTPHHLQADDRRVVRQVKEMEGSREKEKGEGRGEKGGAVEVQGGTESVEGGMERGSQNA